MTPLRPPGPSEDFLAFTWPAGVEFYRVGPSAFPQGHVPYLGKAARFSPLVDTKGNPVPTLYGADSGNRHMGLSPIIGALSETVFHDTVRGGTIDYRTRVEPMTVFVVAPTRALRLADFTSHGLERLGKVKNVQMIEGGPRTYHRTQEWSVAVHQAGFDGITWMSRLHNPSRALMVFGDHVVVDPKTNDLRLVTTWNASASRNTILSVADDLDIDVLNVPGVR